MDSSSCPPPTAHRPLLSWHGFHLTLPPEWSPVKIEGGWDRGSIQIADFHSTRLAMRWQSVKRPAKFDADGWTRDAIRGEVGELMLERSTPFKPSDEWSVSRLFLEPEPPGRDVWVGHHAASGRLLEIIAQATTRSRLLPDDILPSLHGTTRESNRFWSVFDLSCTVPAGWTLESQRLNAGDLTLTFAHGRDTLIVRQVGPATLALARQPLAKWLTLQQRVWRKFYRSNPGRASGDVDVSRSGERPHPSPLPEGEGARSALAIPLIRKRRFFYMRYLARERSILALHDAARDRIVFVDAPTRSLAEETLATVGHWKTRLKTNHGEYAGHKDVEVTSE